MHGRTFLNLQRFRPSRKNETRLSSAKRSKKSTPAGQRREAGPKGKQQQKEILNRRVCVVLLNAKREETTDTPAGCLDRLPRCPSTSSVYTEKSGRLYVLLRRVDTLLMQQASVFWRRKIGWKAFASLQLTTDVRPSARQAASRETRPRSRNDVWLSPKNFGTFFPTQAKNRPRGNFFTTLSESSPILKPADVVAKKHACTEQK